MTALRISDLITPTRVIPRLRSGDKRHVLHELARRMSRGLELPERVIVEASRRCSDLPAFGPSRGVVLPHAFAPNLESPIAAFARLDPPVDFDATDGYPADLVVLLVSPARRTSLHLQALSCIARGLRDRIVRERIRAAKSRDEIYAALVGTDWFHRPASTLPRSWGKAPYGTA